MNLFWDENYNTQALALLDENFLATLSEQKERDIYARIISLDINENPIDQIEGRVTGGSINIDGNSAIRRTCSLSMITDKVDINEFYWGIKTKFKLEIGLRNRLTGQYAPTKDGIYPEIMWFPQGYFIVSGFNTSISTNNCTISLSGKDKMCLLNGDLGGQLYASIDFGTEETFTTIMEPITLSINANSESITLKDYYIKPKKRENINVDNQNKILANNSQYCFIYNQDSGNYYKQDNLYYESIDNSPRNNSPLKYYDMYKKIDDPMELYELITDPLKEYEQNTYYYKDIEGVYVLESASKFTSGKTYYMKIGENTFREVLFYEPEKYYYKKSKEEKYFILDTTSSLSNNRTYYKLVPLYQQFTDITKKKITIEKIIRESVHAYAKEPYYNIIINDLDDYGLEQLTYKGDTILYALYEVNKDEFTNLIFEGKNISLERTIEKIKREEGHFDFYSTEHIGTPIYLKKDNKEFVSASEINNNNNDYTEYTLFKIEYGTDVGYRLTDLTYPGDLISNVGDSLTSMLDKIKNMLGDFEYFYDINGRFVFQKKKTYVNTSWSQITNNQDETYVDYSNNQSKFSFNFEGNRLISAIQNSPVLNNLRNDFIVWGKRKGVSGADIPIHARFAIDKKPVYYKALNNKIYTTDKKYAIQHSGITEEDLEIGERERAIKSFTLQYSTIDENGLNQDGLTAPKPLGDGTWTPGWWDIRDWARYYKLLTNTTKDPSGTMKFYSSNDENGCVLFSTIAHLEGINNRYKTIDENTNRKNSVWLLEITKNNINFPQSINLGHGFGIYNNENRRTQYYHDSTINENGTVVTTKTDITGEFAAPYKNCADSHTYLHFLKSVFEKSDGTFHRVYFYNPNFPLGETAEQLIEDRITEDFLLPGESKNIYFVDWREIIYQMALDFFAGQGCSEENPLYIAKDLYDDSGNMLSEKEYYPMTDPDHFLYEVGQRNPYYYPTGYTGYEQYYTDMQGFWRTLYNPDYLPEAIYSIGKYEDKLNKKEDSVFYTKTKNWVEPLIQDYNIEYYVNPVKEAIHLQREELFQLKSNVTNDEYGNILNDIIKKYNQYTVNSEDNFERMYWNRNVFEHPELLDFWIDFLDSDMELAQFAVSQVGDRTKVVNETSKSTAIIYTDIPGLILYDKNQAVKDDFGEVIKCDESKLRREIVDKSGYKFIYLPKGFSQFFTISYRTASLKNKIDELLYQFGYCVENITITSVPIYYLQPNTRIFVQDKNTNINGEYIVSKLTIPLGYNGTMSITASKAPERLY